jgi:pantoate--beta-alanine ligase
VSALVLTTIAGLRAAVAGARRAGGAIGLVPTMGALHEGHGSLIDLARAECGSVVVSVFVNPTQFNQREDFERYPRPLAEDVAFCSARDADVVFAPAVPEMYPRETLTTVEVSRVTEGLCGAYRPGHFRGVATVVAKLFHIVQPDRAYFGEKDAQQLAAIRRMALDLDMPVEIVAGPTVREADGLAMSSRNRHLTPEERAIAPALYRTLSAARERIANGETDPAAVRQAALADLGSHPALRIEYLEVVDPEDMQPVALIAAPVRIALAAWLGATRLIDNVAAQRATDSAH